jgi:hypothetical protein
MAITEAELAKYQTECVDVSELALNQEFVRQSADENFWNERCAMAHKAFNDAKAHLDQLKARKQIEYREVTLPANGKKVTEASVEAYVEIDAEVIGARAKAIDAEVEYKRLWGFRDVLRGKREMILELGAQLRQEMRGDPQLRAEVHEERRGRQES